jgi:rhamnosyl/mannosyltransferase
MEICLASHRYAPMVGGYDNQIKLLAENLSESFHVKVVTYNLTNSPASESMNGVEVHRIKPQLTLFRVPLAVDYLKMLGKLEFDVLHAHGFIPLVSDLSILSAKLRKKCAVYTHHFDGNIQDSALLNLAANFYNETMGRSCLSLADALVTTTKSYAESSPMMKPHLKKITVIPCFVDCDSFTPQPLAQVLELKRRLGLNGKKVVLFVGRIVPYKGVEYLLKAFEQINESGEKFELLIVGGEEGSKITNHSAYFQEIQHLANSEKIKDNVQFLGRIDGSQLPLYYSLADVVVLPSVMRGEAFGSVLIESLACGTPVVASNLPGVNEVLKGNNQVGCYVAPRDPDALSNAITKMVDQKPQVTEQCRQFAENNYSAKEIAKDYMKLYSSLN